MSGVIKIINTYFTEFINKHNCDGCTQSFYNGVEKEMHIKCGSVKQNINNKINKLSSSLSSTINNENISICPNCKTKHYCINCLNKLTTHKEQCNINNGCFTLFSLSDNIIDINKEIHNIYLCPADIGKGFLTPKTIEYFNDYNKTIIQFNEVKHLIMINENDKIFWVFGDGAINFI